MTPDWIACDWGTSNLRLWAMKDGAPVGERRSDRGMGRLDGPQAFEDALIEAAGDWAAPPVTVVACGMVGARQGWIEAPYIPVPAKPSASGLVRAPTRTPGLSVHIVPGMSQADPADVMRGEETQIAGHLALHRNWDGVLCLPGTHTKWAHVSVDEVVSFQTYMTGEMFAVLGQHSVLRHSLTDGWDDAAFEAGLEQGFDRPERLANRLFSLRAESLLSDPAPGAARARLSGLLIGAEIASAKPYWLGQRVAVLGDGVQADLYLRALAVQSVPVERSDATRATLAGLAAAHAALTA
ncbi:2-dehydro-3-deoxygalactonokinase [Wenxinia saemankumensis]|uniref:2-dehydro-3-deoxygalactonokinase n=1 Tax=Wenxinia saemankumensis TaxID=1447782 RepID=A0A1M6E560_9RHOB|nr:2-dehydro-3-deoxygalactonokinase [Wenxinia saemankumensis]SHI80533.1 2-dehydro-3-deoxygalactonokinase [Wenxinia saemankumensis]